MRLIPLGTNGFFPSFGRETACYAIPIERKLIILDAGTGLFRLAEPIGKKLLSNIKEVHLYLSHYHLDHTFGFYAAFKLLEKKKVTVFGSHRRQVFREFVALKYFPIDYPKKHKNFKWLDLSEGKHKIADYEVAVIKQNHREEISLAYRFSFGLAYVTDGELGKGVVDFVRGVPLLLREHGEIGKKGGETTIDGHTTTITAAEIAKEAKVGKLALIHHKPFKETEKLKKHLEAARMIFPKTELALDTVYQSFS